MTQASLRRLGFSSPNMAISTANTMKANKAPPMKPHVATEVKKVRFLSGASSALRQATELLPPLQSTLEPTHVTTLSNRLLIAHTQVQLDAPRKPTSSSPISSLNPRPYAAKTFADKSTVDRD
jgi:hypothetical protein